LHLVPHKASFFSPYPGGEGKTHQAFGIMLLLCVELIRRFG
jgi:hypothetical protein